jgi:hypothetical protein
MTVFQLSAFRKPNYSKPVSLSERPQNQEGGSRGNCVAGPCANPGSKSAKRIGVRPRNAPIAVTKPCVAWFRGRITEAIMPERDYENRFSQILAYFDYPRYEMKVLEMINQPSLFPEPEPPPVNGSAVLDFELALKDGSKVLVHYVRRRFKHVAHLEFRGGSISSTGHRSFFPPGNYFMDATDGEVKEAAYEVAERLRTERLDEIAKENRQRNRKQKRML